MSVHSAGILCYRYRAQLLEVFLVHPGGPFWARRDDGAWSIPKGIINADESALAAAMREFHEETGFEVNDGFIALGQLQQASKKIVHVWAVQTDFDAAQLRSNTFELEWPRGSGQLREYPEVDRGDWFSLARARQKIYKGQQAFLDRLLGVLANQSRH
ncbi:MAG: NUDIX domain-containing protein [Gammaproteobacteria bacterium]|jgi:predicted NUDIX family NTP pyrophosphohydrolase